MLEELKKWMGGSSAERPFESEHGEKAKGREDAAFRAVCAARDAAWEGVGTCDADVLAPLINPAFTGGARWPGLRQAFRRTTLDSDGLAIIASDGLADPFDDEGPSTGLGAEVYLASTVFAAGDLHDLSAAWQFSTIYCVAQTVADNGFFLGPLLDSYGVVSMGVEPSDVPDDWRGEDGAVGVLLGIGVPGIPEAVTVGENVMKLVGVVPLRPDELELILQDGKDARDAIAVALRALPTGELVSPDRRSVLPVS